MIEPCAVCRVDHHEPGAPKCKTLGAMMIEGWCDVTLDSSLTRPQLLHRVFDGGRYKMRTLCGKRVVAAFSTKVAKARCKVCEKAKVP